MKKQIFTALAVALILISAVFTNIANSQTETATTLQANGTITHQDSGSSKPEFIIRYIWIGSLTSPSGVDAYVAAHPWGTGIMLTDVSSGILSVISYTGWNANQTWEGSYGGISYEQLKSVIDEFHKLRLESYLFSRQHSNHKRPVHL